MLAGCLATAGHPTAATWWIGRFAASDPATTSRSDSPYSVVERTSHWSMRVPWDENEALWGGYVLRGEEGAAYHSGDTAYVDGFAESRRLPSR
jgi:L-ascorbate metabolism protein UlaG (beta-lactamase superfamily)